jgi:membrane-associated protease RseP (regulator of RpoE activity)
MNSHGHVYARYGSRRPKKAQDESLMSVAGLRAVMRKVLEAHATGRDLKPASPAASPRLAESFVSVPPEMKSGAKCIHCHHVWVYGQKERPRFPAWRSPEIPLPEKIGLTLDVDRGNVVRSVDPEGAAAKAGIRENDVVTAVNGVPVYSAADLSWFMVLRGKEEMKVDFLRGAEKKEAVLPPAGP